MRKLIVVALVLVVVGVGVSFLLIPDENEVATMQARDVKTVDMGNVDVEAEYNQGRRSFPIVSGLADKRIAEGNRPAAIQLLEEFVKNNPNDVNGRKKLAEQYQLAGDNAKYNEQLEAIAAAEPTEANLRVLSDIYNADKNYPKQVEVLKKMLAVTKGEKPEIFADLATIQVVVGDKDGALQTINDLKAKHPDYESYPVTRIQVNILSEKGQVDDAFAMAKAWCDRPIPPMDQQPQVPPQANPPGAVVQSPPNPAGVRAREVADLANILHYSGHADKAVELIQPHVDLLPQSTELVVAYVNAMITLGKDDDAYALLQQMDQAGKMTPELYHPYLQLAIKREDVPAAEAIATKMDVVPFNEEQALNIIELARATNAKTVLAILLDRFEQPAILEHKPVLTAVISILKNEKDQDTKIETALNTQLSGVQRVRLAESCARAGKTQCFDAVVKLYPTIPEMTPAQVDEYAQLYIIADRPGDIIEPVSQRAAAVDAHPDVIKAYINLAAAAGREDITKPWLQANANSVPMLRLQEIFYIATDHHRDAIASDVAERLYARDPSPMNREIMISALVRAGEYNKAVPLLREQVAAGGNDTMYLSTLSKLARKDSAARKELNDYAEASLRSNKGDDRAQVNYAYVLLNNGRRDAAMPFIRDYAKARGGEWKKMQAQLTRSTGKAVAARKLTREERVAMAENPKISETNKRQLAFSLLNDGYKDDATKIFGELAANKGPDSQEMKDLLYMWGGKLTPEQLAWIEQRAAASDPYEKEKWGDLINNSGDDYAILQYVSSTPDALYNRNLRQRYFRIVATSGNRDNYDTRMRPWVAQTTDVPALTDYATMAQSYGYYDAARNAWRRIDTLDPQNEKALAALGALTFMQSDYTTSEGYLNRYITTVQNNPQPQTDPSETLLYKAQLLKRQGDMQGAKQYFQAVVNAGANDLTPAGRDRVYTALFNLGQHDQAKQGFEKLLSLYPEDKSILGDYMSALIEFKYYDDATRVANQYDKSSPYYGRTSAIMGSNASVSSVEQLSGGREMKITFAQPIEENAPVDMKQVKKLGWVEQASLGYDSMTVSAKPGYMVRYVPTADEQFAVVPAQTQQIAPQDEQLRQQDLRLQLLYARIEQETGHGDRARDRLNALRQYYPNDAQLLAYTANIENANGNPTRAMHLLQTAQQLTPENEDITRLINDMRHGGRGTPRQFVKLDHEYRNYGSIHEHITTISGVARVADRTEVGFNLANDFLNPKVLINPKTGNLTRDSVARQAMELFVGQYLDDGSRIQGSLFHNTDALGLGGYYAFNNSLGRTEALLEWQKPYWDFGEAVHTYATRDRIGAKHYVDIRKGTSLGLETSLNNYNIKVQDSVAQSALFRLSLTQQLQEKTAEQPYWGIGYGFDGEYLFGHSDTRTVGPNTWRPFPLRSREVHQLTGIYQDDWTDSTHVELQAGYAYDRLGGNGPVVAGNLTQDITEQLEAGLRARYGLQTSVDDADNSDSDAINIGADLMYKF